MAVQVDVRYTGNVEGDTHHVDDATKGTLDIVLHNDGVQDMGNVKIVV